MTNCNRTRNKQAEIAELCSYMDLDAIMCKNKLDKTVKSSEFLPVNYTTCFHKVRTTHSGGSLIALKSHYVAEEVDLSDIDCEIMCAKIILPNTSPVYMGSFYHPRSDPISSLETLEVALTRITDSCKNNTKATVAVIQPGSMLSWASLLVINPVWWNLFRTTLASRMTITVRQ